MLGRHFRFHVLFFPLVPLQLIRHANNEWAKLDDESEQWGIYNPKLRLQSTFVGSNHVTITFRNAVEKSNKWQSYISSSMCTRLTCDVCTFRSTLCSGSCDRKSIEYDHIVVCLLCVSCRFAVARLMCDSAKYNTTACAATFSPESAYSRLFVSLFRLLLIGKT